jgi:hypothetical protein
MEPLVDQLSTGLRSKKSISTPVLICKGSDFGCALFDLNMLMRFFCVDSLLSLSSPTTASTEIVLCLFAPFFNPEFRRLGGPVVFKFKRFVVEFEVFVLGFDSLFGGRRGASAD